MNRPIYASPRFGLLVAIAVLLGAFVLEAIGTTAAGVIYGIGVVYGSHAWAGANSGTAAVLTMIGKLTGAVTIAALVLHRSRESWRSVGRAGFTPVTLVVLFVPIVAGITIVLSELDNLLRAFLPARVEPFWNLAPTLNATLAFSWTGPLLAIVVGPVCEELVFRGLVLRGLLGRYRPWTAVVVSAASFAAMHLNPAQMPIALGLGALLGWIYMRTRSLGLCVLGHALNNSASYVVGFVPFEIDGFNRVPEVAGNVFQPWWFDGIGFALIAAGIWFIHRLAPAAEPWAVAPSPEPPPLEPPLLEPPLLSPAPTANDGCQPAIPEDASAFMSADLARLVTSLAQRARAASLVLATVPTAAKNAALAKLADLIDASHAALLAANARDLASPEAAALAPAARDRLKVDPARLQHLAASVRDVIALPDPVGAELEAWTRPNGLRIRKVRVPIGVIGIIYESRPNVTVDCAILCLKSGNACILRGGKESFHTNMALTELIQRAIADSPLSALSSQLSAA